MKNLDTELKPETMSKIDMEGLILHVLYYAYGNREEFFETPALKDTYYNTADIYYLIQEYKDGNLRLKEKTDDC